MEELYIIGQKVANGYPEGRYVATRLKGRVHDHYIIIGVLNYPSIRSVANTDKISRAEVKKYGEMIHMLRDERTREPERYDGSEIIGDSAESYNESLLRAMDEEKRRMIEQGDSEAAFEMARRKAYFLKELEEDKEYRQMSFQR